MPMDRKGARSLREQWGLFLVEGVVLLVLGLAAIVLPPIALALALFLGWILAIAGLVGLLTTLLMHAAPGFPASLVSVFTDFVALVAAGCAFPAGFSVAFSVATTATFSDGSASPAPSLAFAVCTASRLE